jgi:hypothetical protein
MCIEAAHELANGASIRHTRAHPGNVRMPLVRSATMGGRTMTLRRCHPYNAKIVARAKLTVVLALTVVLQLGCASTATQSDFQAFLQKIAVECKPLIIGSDDIGQAIIFNGLGAVPEHYNNFLGQTSALFGGSITPDTYRASLDAFLGSGSYNRRSFDCIIGHLPATPPAAPAAQPPRSASGETLA